MLHLKDSKKDPTKPQCNKKPYHLQHFITTRSTPNAEVCSPFFQQNTEIT